MKLKILFFLISSIAINNLHSQLASQQALNNVQINNTISTESPEKWARESFGSYNQHDEIIEKRDANSKHFRNGDGTITAVIAAGNINYQEDGLWKTIFHSIEPTASGFRNISNSFKTFYPLNANGHIRTTLPNGAEFKDLMNMRMYFQTGTTQMEVKYISSAQGNTNFNQLTYPNVYGPGIDLRLTQNTTQRKLDYLISSKNSLGTIPPSAEWLIFEEQVELPNGWVAQIVGNTIEVKDANGQVQFIFEKPVFKDSPVHTHEEELNGNVDHTNCSANHNGHELIGNYEMIQNGNILTIKTKVPMSWMLDDSRTYPVVIDPTVNCIPDNVANWTGYIETYSGSTSADEGTSVFTSTNITSSVSDDIILGRYDDGWGGYYAFNSWMKFNITSVPDQSCISGASINYYVYNNASNQSDCRVWARLRHLVNDPVIVANAARLTDIRDGNIYQNQNLSLNGTGNGLKTVSLSSNISDIQNQLSANWFGAGLNTYAGAYGHTTCYIRINGHSSTNKPTLVIVYSTDLSNAGPDITICGGSTVLNGSSNIVSPSQTSATYSAGIANTELVSSPTTATNSTCPINLSVTIPVGATIIGVDVSYKMFANGSNSAYMSEQRSYLQCTSTGGGKEAQIYAGSGNQGGTNIYSRNGLTIANGVTGGGTINFSLHAFRTWGGSGCSNNYNQLVNNSFTIIVHYITPIVYSWSPATNLSNPSVFNPTASPASTIIYSLSASSGACSASDQVTVTVQTPVGNPAVFGNNVWNVYGYNGDNINLAANTYRGYYIQPDLGGGNHGVNTQAFWSNGNSPSDAGVAINTGNIWNGCNVNPDYHTVVQKRKGFPCGTYNLSMNNWDDETRVYLNGALIWSCTAWSGAGTCPTGNIGMHMLDGDSELEIRSFEQVGGSNVEMSVIAVTPTQLSVNGSTRTCRVSGGNSFIFFLDANGRLIAAINPQNQDLGYVTMTSYVDPTNALVPACAYPTYPEYMTSMMQRHWVINKTNPAATPVQVGLPFLNSELGSLVTVSNANANIYDNVSVIGEVLLSKYQGPNNVNSSALDNCAVSGGNENMTLHGQTGNGNLAGIFPGFVNTSYATYSVPNFSEFWLHGASNNSPLPITLSSFAAVCNETGDEVNVQWTTASESNTSHFDIERSLDGSNWDLLGTTNAAGNSTTTQHYEMKDLDARGHSVIYYRLKQYDNDGAMNTYGPVSAECLVDQNSFELFPNPAETDVTILLNGDFEDGTEILFTDLNGKEVKKISYDEKSGKLLNVDLRDLETGIYIVRLLSNDSTNQFVRLVKQ